MKKCIVLLFLFALMACAASAQQNTATGTSTNKIYRVELKDGMVFNGQVISSDSLEMVFRTMAVSEFKVLRTAIVKMNELKEVNTIQQSDLLPSDNSGETAIRKNKPVYEGGNPFPMQYFFGNSAFQLQQGQAYYQNTYVFLNTVQYGVSNYFSLGLGTELISMIAREFPMIYLTPKLGFSISKDFALGAGGTIVFGGEPFDRRIFGMGYAMATFGSRNNNITVSLGTGNLSDKDFHPNIGISAALRLSNKFLFITDNQVFSYPHATYAYIGSDESYYSDYRYTGLLSVGFRYFNRNFAFDFGLLGNSATMSDMIAIPYVDVIIKL